jgi:transcriptional regulator with XRE-family HTH domain
MERSVNLTALGLAIFLARTLRGWNQTDLADASGLTNSMISEFERGRRNPSEKSLQRLADALNIPLPALYNLIPILERFRETVRVGVEERMGREQEGRARIDPLADDMVRSTLDLIFHGKMPRREFPPGPQDRDPALEAWARLRAFDLQDQLLLIEKGSEYRSWALCELACHESVEAVRDDPARALELANLAVRIAEKTPGTEAWRSKVQGYAWTHLGNARRASGDPTGADEALLKAGFLWRAGTAAGNDLLDEEKLREIDEAVVGA